MKYIAECRFPAHPNSSLARDGFTSWGERWTITADSLESARAKVLARFADPTRPSYREGWIESLETSESWDARRR
jgi:hypothetical protein